MIINALLILFLKISKIGNFPKKENIFIARQLSLFA